MNNTEHIADYYTRHHDEVIAFFTARIADEDTAQDLTQELFLRLLQRKNMLIAEQTLPALVYAMARNMVVDYFRRRRCREQYEYLLYRSERTTEIESVVSARLVMERMEHSLARLSEESAKIYRLHIYEGMRTDEIAKELCLSYKHVEYRLGQVRKIMQHN